MQFIRTLGKFKRLNGTVYNAFKAMWPNCEYFFYSSSQSLGANSSILIRSKYIFLNNGKVKRLSFIRPRIEDSALVSIYSPSIYMTSNSSVSFHLSLSRLRIEESTVVPIYPPTSTSSLFLLLLFYFTLSLPLSLPHFNLSFLYL